MAPSPEGPMQTWWEGIAKAREQIRALNRVLGPLGSLDALQESERPAKGLLEDEMVSERLCLRLSQPNSGKEDDELCQWLYETYQTGDADLQAVVLRYVPVLCGVYMSKICRNANESLAGFEAVLLALYTAETTSRGGRAVVVNIPDLSQPSLYHTPRNASNTASTQPPRFGLLSSPLEPQVAVRATKRSCIVGVALNLFCRKIALMPVKAKIEACLTAKAWAGEVPDCSREQCNTLASPAKKNNEMLPDGNHTLGSLSGPACEIEVLEAGSKGITTLARSPPSPEIAASPSRVSPSFSSPARKDHPLSSVSGKYNHLFSSLNFVGNATVDMHWDKTEKSGFGARIPLPWELVQPVLKLLGHCVMAPLNPQELKDAASDAIHALYLRASHDLIPEAILATRSLIQLDSASRIAAKATTSTLSFTPPKPKKPEILLVSK